MKGQTSYPFSMLEAGITFLILISIIYGSQNYTESFLMEETADAQADRVENAAIAVDSLPQGHLELPISRYEYKIDGSEIILQFRDAEESRDLNHLSVDEINGSSELTEVEGLCLEKRDDEDETILDFTSGDCQ